MSSRRSDRFEQNRRQLCTDANKNLIRGEFLWRPLPILYGFAYELSVPADWASIFWTYELIRHSSGDKKAHGELWHSELCFYKILAPLFVKGKIVFIPFLVQLFEALKFNGEYERKLTTWSLLVRTKNHNKYNNTTIFFYSFYVLSDDFPISFIQTDYLYRWQSLEW